MGVVKIGECTGTGFFSCCSSRLDYLIQFLKKNNNYADYIDSSNQFNVYKDTNDKDISSLFFDSTQTVLNENDLNFDNISFGHSNQYIDYNKLDYKHLNILLKKYFKPSFEIDTLGRAIADKYNIDYANTLGVFYRGNDKVTETRIAPYNLFIDKIDYVLKNNPTLKILIQTDEQEFLDTALYKFNNAFFIKEIPVIKKQTHQVIHNLIKDGYKKTFAKYFFATSLILSKCKFLITHSGNCGMWVSFYRDYYNNNNPENLYQYLNFEFIKK